MVEEKIIHYNDGLIIECMSEFKARVMIPINIVKDYIENDKNSYYLFMNRLEKDFNFKNVGGFYMKTECTPKYMVLNFTRKIIPIK